MHCRDVEKAILQQGAAGDAAMRGHLAGCPSCRQFARLHQALLEGDLGPEPVPALDERVREAARQRLQRGWRLLSGRQAAALAACAALILGGVLWLAAAGRRPSQGAVETAEAAPAPRMWAHAQADLASIEEGLDAAVAELGGLGAPSASPGGAADAGDVWDALMELEFDVYFETQNLWQTGG